MHTYYSKKKDYEDQREKTFQAAVSLTIVLPIFILLFSALLEGEERQDVLVSGMTAICIVTLVCMPLFLYDLRQIAKSLQADKENQQS